MKNNFVLLKEEHREEKTASGIILPEPKWKRRCRVIAAEPDSPVKPGELVLRNMGKGTDITINGEEFEVLHIDWIIAVIDEQEEY